MIWMMLSIAHASTIAVEAGKTKTVTGPVFVVPEPIFTKNLAAAEKCAAAKQTFEEYRETSRHELDESTSALKVAQARIKEDGQTITDQTVELQVVKTKLRRANNRTGVVIGVAATVVLTATATLYVTGR
jgi:hypothetical protein